MNTFFRIAVYLCFALIIFNVAFGFVVGLNVFPIEGEMGQDIEKTPDALSALTGLTDPGMTSLWLLVVGMGTAAGVIISIFTHSVIPIGIAVFGDVFWTSWMRTNNVINLGGYLPGDFILIFTVGMLFLFIAATIGMLTGSG